MHAQESQAQRSTAQQRKERKAQLSNLNFDKRKECYQQLIDQRVRGPDLQLLPTRLPALPGCVQIREFFDHGLHTPSGQRSAGAWSSQAEGMTLLRPRGASSAGLDGRVLASPGLCSCTPLPQPPDMEVCWGGCWGEIFSQSGEVPGDVFTLMVSI